MAEAGFVSLLVPSGGGGGAPPFVPGPSPRLLNGALTPAQDLLARLLRRLPVSLWDTDPSAPTLQRDLFRAFASEMAVWVEQREIARTMTLLLEAQGIDLDVLLHDYGLQRYLQRPDPYARQLAMHLLWTPQGTLYSAARVADLLFDLPHVTLRTGRSQQHVFVAATHPVTTPVSYWGLVSAQGVWYALTVHKTVPLLSQVPPPGLDVSPGPHTLTWFTVTDALHHLWYVSIDHGTLQLTDTPPAGYGTDEPFSVLDGTGTRWGLQAAPGGTTLVSLTETALTGFDFWQIRARNGTLYALWIEYHVPTIATVALSGAIDHTPGGTPLEWFTVFDRLGTAWYVSLEDGTLLMTGTSPGGLGTEALAAFVDARGQRWVLTADRQVLLATASAPADGDLVVVAPGAPFQAFELRDATGDAWWVSIDHGTLLVSPTLPLGATDVTPPDGPYRWWRMYDAMGTFWYVWPATYGVLLFDQNTPGGLGTKTPQMLGDRHGVLWQVGIGRGLVGVSDAPPVTLPDTATALCMTDATGGRWFWRIHHTVLEWSPVLWPDTIDQSPWGELGWLQVVNTAGDIRYIFATPTGSARAAGAPPPELPWGLQTPWTFHTASGQPWYFTVLPDDRVGTVSAFADTLTAPTVAVPLREALDAFAHVQAAGSHLTLLVT